MNVIQNKFDAFFSKLRKTSRDNSDDASASNNSDNANANRSVVSVKFDAVSNIHLFTRTCITESYKACGMPCPRLVYSSLPKVMEKFSTKRSVVGKVKERIRQGL